MSGKQKWDGQTKAKPLGIRIFMKLISWFGLIPAYSLLVWVSLYYVITNKTLRKSLKSFRTKLSLKTNIFHIYKHVFVFGLNLIDRFAYPVLKKPFKIITFGEENIFDALMKNNGLIMLSAHVGNQEVAGDILFDRIKTKINFLMYDNEKEEIKKVTNDLTKNRSVNIIPISQNSMEMMFSVQKALSNNEIIAMSADRYREGDSVHKLSFLGKETFFPSGPFKIAAVTGAPITIATTVKTGFKTYEQKIYSYINFEGEICQNRKNKVLNLSQEYVKILENIVKKHPYHWFNYYDFWNEFL